MIIIDGSGGEGGGQILRTALSLSALTGKPFRIERIRAGRRQPGLRPQHLTAARAAAAICGARLEGDLLGSRSLLFEPQHTSRAGRYEFDVREASSGGSAGSASLVLQTLLLPLAAAAGSSTLVLRGGTHVAWSPPFHYLQEVYLPCLRRMGIVAGIALDMWGWYPQGGGEMQATIRGAGLVSDPRGTCQETRIPSSMPGIQPPPSPFQMSERGELRRIWGISATSRLPDHVRQRMRQHALTLLRPAGVRAEIETIDAPSPGPGAGMFLFAEYESESGEIAPAGFSGFGRRGKPAEAVASEAAQTLLAHHRSGAVVDPHLADQIILPLALSGTTARFRTSEITRHLETNAQVVSHFLDVHFRLGGPGVEDGTVSLEAG
jgi:RNA 3'-terminal phosphate cyclase (ATP)